MPLTAKARKSSVTALANRQSSAFFGDSDHLGRKRSDVIGSRSSEIPSFVHS